MALLIGNCPEAGWIKTTATPGFEGEGYWAIRIRRGSRIGHSEGRNNNNKSMRSRWENRYAQKNAARQNKMSKWAGWRVKI